MDDIGLGIGRSRQVVGGIEQEVLLWHDRQSNPYPMADQLIQEMQSQLQTERQRAEHERQRAERLADYLKSQGIDPKTLV